MTAWWMAGILALSPLGPGSLHAPWDNLLEKYVSGGWVDYGGLQSERSTLEGYLAALGETKPEAMPTEAEQLAFWINAYNAFVVKGVLDRYPLKSVKDVDRFFTEKKNRVAGAMLSLDDIEAKARSFGDSRVHFAVVCASRSCPALSREAYWGERLDTQLDRAAREFLADEFRGLSIDAEKKVLYLSRIFQWYGGDFKAAGRAASFWDKAVAFLDRDSVIPYIKEFLPEDRARALEGLEVRYKDYDWSLNGRQDAHNVHSSCPAGERPASRS